MSTRSMLCIKQSDGSLKSMFKHWDGYPSFMVPFLEKYDTDELAEELVRFETVQSLLTEEQLQHNLEAFPQSNDWAEEKLYKLSTGDYMVDGDGVPKIYANLRELFHEEWPVDYVYVWNGYKWVIIDPDADEIK